MRGGAWMWRLGVATFGAGVLIIGSPALSAVSAVSLGDVTFSWGHVLVLIAAASVWGDSRARQTRTERDVEAINKKLDAIESRLPKQHD